jgi:hypothetical protein
MALYRGEAARTACNVGKKPDKYRYLMQRYFVAARITNLDERFQMLIL